MSEPVLRSLLPFVVISMVLTLAALTMLTLKIMRNRSRMEKLSISPVFLLIGLGVFSLLVLGLGLLLQNLNII